LVLVSAVGNRSVTCIYIEDKSALTGGTGILSLRLTVADLGVTCIERENKSGIASHAGILLLVLALSNLTPALVL
jgi:hypothetical protein